MADIESDPSPRPASVPALLRLSPELLDRIILLSLPSQARPARLALSKLLRVCRTLAPLVRRHLYAKLALVVAAPSGQDRRLVDLLHAGIAGDLVRILKVRAPNPDPSWALEPGAGPLWALVPQPRMSQPETLAWVADALDHMPCIRHLELELRVGTWFEDDTDPAGDFGADARAQLDRLRGALVRWGASLETALVALEDVEQRLQVWAQPGLGRAPHVGALAAWDRLTTLDLWRVRLVLTARDDNDDELPPAPTFRLRHLNLTQCELGGAAELRWLLGAAGSPRSSALVDLTLGEVDFTHHPRSSAPLLAVFPDPARAGSVEPAFASTLSHLTLLLAHPIGGSACTPAGLLAPLGALRKVTVGGPASTIRSLHRSAGITTLSLQYLSHSSLPLPALLALLFPRSSGPAPLAQLRTLSLHEAWDHARRTPWSVRHSTAEPLWKALAVSRGGWDAVVEVLRWVARTRRREEREPVRLMRNKLRVDYFDEDEEDDSAAGGDEHGDGSSSGSDADDTGSAASASASPDPNALFVPLASDGEEETDWEGLARREREMMEQAMNGVVEWDSDF